VDFLVGFTIFIFSLIIVANMVPSLLVGLQRTTSIDYDAVAYRTAVILAEDPGEPTEPDRYMAGDSKPWDFYTPAQILGGQPAGSSVRFGLAVSRENPNILSQRRINRFFDDAFEVNNYQQYRKSLIFGQIAYGFNITLTRLNNQPVLSVGSPYPEGRYGYIRRYVKIKEYSSATITNKTPPQTPPRFHAVTEYMPPNSQYQYFRVSLSGPQLYKRTEGGVDKFIYSPAYVIDPTQDNITVNLGLEGFLNNSHVNPDAFADLDTRLIPSDTAAWAQNCDDPLNEICSLPTSNPYYQGTPPNFASLRSITIQDSTGNIFNDLIVANGGTITVVYHDPLTDTMKPLANLNPPAPQPAVPVGKWVNLSISSIPDVILDQTKGLDIVYQFGEDPRYIDGMAAYVPRTLISGTLLYDYNTANVTQPALFPGILEVAIW